jgi:hypothetical protein
MKASYVGVSVMALEHPHSDFNPVITKPSHMARGKTQKKTSLPIFCNGVIYKGAVVCRERNTICRYKTD